MVGLLLVAVILVAGGVIWWAQDEAVKPTATSTVATTSSATTRSRFRQSSWRRPGLSNETRGALRAGDVARRAVALSWGDQAFSVTVEGQDHEVKLVSPSGRQVAAQGFRYNPVTGQMEWDFLVPDNRESGEWEVVITAPPTSSTDSDEDDDDEDVDYQIHPPAFEENPLVHDQTPPVIDATPGVDLSILVEETFMTDSGSMVRPVVGARVVAGVTDPSGDVLAVELPAVSGQPGNYAGVYPNRGEVGIYRIEYEITGQDSTGRQFVHYAYGQFEIVATAGGGSTSTNQWYKKYDINRAGDVRLLNY